MKTVYRNIKHVSSLQPKKKKKMEEKDVTNRKYKITFINII